MTPKPNLISAKQSALIKVRSSVHQIIIKVELAVIAKKLVRREAVQIGISIKPPRGALTTILQI